MEKTRSGKCFCGAVEIEVKGDPVGMGYCHCNSCRHWSASPVNAFTLWSPDRVRITKGDRHVKEFHRNANSLRKWCGTCGGHLMTEHPEWKLVDVFAAVISDVEFKPGVHVNYQDTVLPMKDGLPKLRDFPKELGGTGESVPE
jgi:hypothetical protein